jgi:hypothetical protein
MESIDPTKIELIDYFHNPKQNPSYYNPDDRDILDYNLMLKTCAKITSVDDLLVKIGSEEAKWVDYCCGKGIALTQGTERFNQGRSNKVSSVGVDIRKVDGLTYLGVPQFVHGQTSFYQHDMDFGVLDSLKPDIITCMKGLLYTNDPLKLFEGMFNQLNEGGYMLVTINTGNEVEGLSDLTTQMLGALLDRNDVIPHAMMFQSEFVVLLNKLKGANKLDFGLELEQTSRDSLTGWTSCNYTWREE